MYIEADEGSLCFVRLEKREKDKEKVPHTDRTQHIMEIGKTMMVGCGKMYVDSEDQAITNIPWQLVISWVSLSLSFCVCMCVVVADLIYRFGSRVCTA